MHGYRRHAAALCHLRKLNRIDIRIIKSLAEFNRNRFMKFLYHRRQNLLCQLRILHQCRTFAVVDNLWHRTTHVDVDDGIRSFLQLQRHLAHNLRI